MKSCLSWLLFQVLFVCLKDLFFFFCLFSSRFSFQGGCFLDNFVAEVDKFSHGVGSNAAGMFAIGEALCGHVNFETGCIFGSANEFELRLNRARKAIKFYEFQLSAYRGAVNTWSLVALRFGVVKDIRLLIGRLIWDARREAKYNEKRA
jgi:hypothetical protein